MIEFRAIDDTHALRGFDAGSMGGSATGPRALICTGDGRYAVHDVTIPDGTDIPESGDLTDVLAHCVDLYDGARLVRIL